VCRPGEISAAVLLRRGRRRVWRKGTQLASLTRSDHPDRSRVRTDFALQSQDAKSVQHQATARSLEPVHPDLTPARKEKDVLRIEHLGAGNWFIGYGGRLEANGTCRVWGADRLGSCGGGRKRCEDGDSSKGFH